MWPPPFSDEVTWEIIHDACESAGYPIEGPRHWSARDYPALPPEVHRTRRRWLDLLIEIGIVPADIMNDLTPEPPVPPVPPETDEHREWRERLAMMPARPAVLTRRQRRDRNKRLRREREARDRLAAPK